MTIHETTKIASILEVERAATWTGFDPGIDREQSGARELRAPKVKVSARNPISSMQRGDLVGDRFEIDELVAFGGMGQVFRARDVQSGEIVALKTLVGNLAALGPRFDREARMLANLSHPGIVRYVAHGVAGSGEPYLAMEWLEGEDLATRLARGTLSLEEGVALAAHVAEAVHAAHTRGIVHRDLKPSNIFLVDRRLERAKVLDFGIARLASGVRLTRTGMMIGTPGYMAPEQVGSDIEIDARADVFSLGCVLFECLTGVFAFMAEHPMALLAKVLFAEPQRLRDVLPAAPEALDALLWRMLAKDPAGRPPHGRAVADALAALGSRPAARAAARPSTALTLGEQRMFSIVLIGGEDPAASADSELRGSPPSGEEQAARVGQMLQTLQQQMAIWGGRIEPLRDGSVAVALGGSGLVTDQAAQVARCALWLRGRVAGRPMALATGRGDRAGKLPAAEIIDRAAEMLVSRAPGAARDGIAIDEVTARLLDARFDVRERGGGYVLHGEHELAEGTRLLLGRPTPCVGREPELRRLEQLFEECTEEPVARVAIVSAPPGTGKSRYAQEFLRSIRARSALAPVAVWLCRGEPHRAGSAFGLLSQLLRDACGIRDGEPHDAQQAKLAARVAALADAEPVRRSGHAEDRARLGSDAGERRRVTELLGEIVGVPFPDDDSLLLRAARRDAQLMNDQMRAAFLDFLQAELEAHPVLLVLEDVQWGDRPTLQFLDAALRDLRDRPLFVLALARPEVHELFSELWAERDVHKITLKQLGKKASEQLVRHVLGEGVARQLVDRLVQLSEGNAFYLEELIRAAAEGRRGDLPETVVAMVQSRLDALDDDGRRVLRAASVFGEVFWSGAVAWLLGSAPDAAEPARWLAALKQRELIIQRKQSRFPDEEEYMFRHALVREGAYATLTDEDRALGHRLAGEWLEQRGVQEPLALAEHFERGGARARAGLCYLRAAEQSHQGADAMAAIAHGRRALACGMPDEQRIRCLGILCEAHAFGVDLLRDALPYAEEVTRDAPRGSGPWSQGMMVKAIGSLQAGALDECVALLETVAATSPPPGEAAPWALCIALGIFLLDHQGRVRVAEPLLHQLGAGIRDLGGDELLASGFFHGTLAYRSVYVDEDPLQGLSHGAECLRISETLGYTRWAANGKVLVGMNHWCLGALADAERALGEVTLADKDGGVISSYRPFILAWLSAERGALDEARRWAEGLVEAGQARRLPVDEGRGHWVLAEVLRRAGDLPAAGAAVEAALSILRLAAPLDVPGVLATLAAVRLAEGKPAEALAAAAEGMARYEAMTACSFFRAPALRLIHARCLEAAGDHAAAQAAIARAHACLLVNAAKIGDPEARERFLEGVPEHRRIHELARR
jgi:eukaryotic-like serine/threonine-protein kinase